MASVVSANRQRWIDGLRDDLAAFLAADFVILDIYEMDHEDITAADRAENRRQVAEAKRDRRLTQRRIQLRLNPEKPHHKELYQAVMDVIPATGKDHRAARSRLIKSAQSLLRREWLRLKAEAGEWEPADERAEHDQAVGADIAPSLNTDDSASVGLSQS